MLTRISASTIHQNRKQGNLEYDKHAGNRFNKDHQIEDELEKGDISAYWLTIADPMPRKQSIDKLNLKSDCHHQHVG